MTAYWIARVTVTDPDVYGEYAKLAGPALAKHGGRFLARGGKCQHFEGKEHLRNVIVEFPSFEAAVTCYTSEDYAEALALALKASVRDVVIVEGAPPS